ncbi:MAG TPA: hypothetical protein DD706_21810 [Nitrospiraceae bacterium]|nr:hypothetical protein [Nitrospiraceae bacterium]
MPALLDRIHPGTLMGANLNADGGTCRAWAPHAHIVNEHAQNCMLVFLLTKVIPARNADG